MTGSTDKNHYQLFTQNGSSSRDWMPRALCRIDGTPHEIREYADQFFPHPTDKDGRNQATDICHQCPVATECDAHRKALKIEHGVWGGVHVDQPKTRGPRPNCGTERAYNRHIQQGEPVDPACLAAGQRAWQRRKDNHAKKKGQK